MSESRWWRRSLRRVEVQRRLEIPSKTYIRTSFIFGRTRSYYTENFGQHNGHLGVDNIWTILFYKGVTNIRFVINSIPSFLNVSFVSVIGTAPSRNVSNCGFDLLYFGQLVSPKFPLGSRWLTKLMRYSARSPPAKMLNKSVSCAYILVRWSNIIATGDVRCRRLGRRCL